MGFVLFLWNSGPIIYAAAAFSLWMFIDCLRSDVKDKIFWAIIIVGVFPIGAILYAMLRRKLLIKPTASMTDGAATINPQAGVTPTPQTSASTTSSQIIRGIGITIGVILSTLGALMLGFIILVYVAFSVGGGSSK